MRLSDEELDATLREFKKNFNKPDRHAPLPEATELALRQEYEDFDTEATHTRAEWQRFYSVHELWFQSHYMSRTTGTRPAHLRPREDAVARLEGEIERLTTRVATLEARTGSA